ncbi:MAG: hypothetical protein A3F31_03360 [Candidatus Levybacteria bacterium RIFCSPHIGHO2_12_FULL_38_12]|nr:MAG: hypothetical protein A2770_03785 [Candidatus Levybacteria bacterium RIFCSPHIGHO2_01_FULL_38_12]OGH22137.1 MAG: hypothetical protein A3D75_02730 [Candidatus Levybacteria bacterium RIFCSPHIGHO2_02_FULL_37_18]OGH22984.1 MAG: hypothetical protein A3F31_03360 [Candidatus Levybacteria bacterium RIFCSPHIGHO2_12_FULL_38_12]OGH34156.1 MAG: hypothetical protein A3A47_03490 [Candidatus Levybacteria bacterium RIFCSPLOWO2_01_FULL_37_20]OGH52482.1 MAG: hypothetical protein A3G13_02180 [Candidatus Lev
MDKKQTELSPKLKEIYERVMSTKISSPAQKPSAPTQPQPASNEVHTPQLTSIAVNPFSSPIKSPIKRQVKNPPQFVLIITGVIFFLAYAFFWVRFFNLKLPFNLPF